MATEIKNGAPRTRAWSEPLSIFAEALLMGVITVALMLPLITFAAGCAAGIAHLRRGLRGEENSSRIWWRDLRYAFRGSWMLSLAMSAVVSIVLVVDQPLLRASVVPGGPLLALVLTLVCVLGVATIVRASARWHVGASWSVLMEAAAASAARRWALVVVLALSLAVLTAPIVPLAIALTGVALLAAMVESVRQPQDLTPAQSGGES